MHDEPMMIDETEDVAEPRRSTRRSWKKFQLVVAGLLTLLVVAIMLGERSGDTFGGATTASVAEFETAMNEYFDKAEQRSLDRVAIGDYNPLQADSLSEAVEREKGLLPARERLRELVDAMNYSNADKAKAEFAFWAHQFNGGPIPDSVFVEGVAADGRPWVMRNIAAGVWAIVKAAIIAFVAAWLLLKLCELFWWFFIDRLRDIADAVRKS